MSEKVDQVEAEALAQEDLSQEMSGQSLEDRFKKLEQSKGPSDALLALKAKMGLVPPSSLPAPTGSSVPALTDEEFAVPDIGVDVEQKTKV
jgi:hypothetical protein